MAESDASVLRSDGDALHRAHVLRLLAYFYTREHLFIVTELLYDNLYVFSR